MNLEERLLQQAELIEKNKQLAQQRGEQILEERQRRENQLGDDAAEESDEQE